jgi:hypothetical protein
MLQVKQRLLLETLAMNAGAKGIAPWAGGLPHIDAQQSLSVAVIGQAWIIADSQVIAEQEKISHWIKISRKPPVTADPKCNEARNYSPTISF